MAGNREGLSIIIYLLHSCRLHTSFSKHLCLLHCSLGTSLLLSAKFRLGVLDCPGSSADGLAHGPMCTKAPNVFGTPALFHFSDLGSAVSVCWISCEAVQPLLAQAVVANGGQAIFSGQPRMELGVKVQDFARKSSRELAEQPAFLSASSLSATFNLYSAAATDGQETPPANQLTSPAPASSNECKQQ